MQVALKIDVDTHQGLAQGVPRLAQMLRREGVRASFYIAMGPDNSGRAIMRVFRNRGFLKKMRRTNAVAMYGLRTVLSGTILPARPIALAMPEVIRDLDRAGFEVGVHGYDHVLWQDSIESLGDVRLRAELEDAFEAYRAILGRRARSFAAPGWRTSDAASLAIEELKLEYRSDTRGRAPYRCTLAGKVLRTVEIPTTLPTLDEVMGRRGLSGTSAIRDFYLSQFSQDALNVHTIHAETEGMSQLELFTDLVKALKQRGAEFVELRDVAARVAGVDLPACPIVRTEIEGRAGWISAQGPQIPAA